MRFRQSGRFPQVFQRPVIWRAVVVLQVRDVFCGVLHNESSGTPTKVVGPMSGEPSGSATGAERVLFGMLALLAADRDERVEGTTPRRTEVILEDAGFSAREIAQLTGKEYEAVRSSLRRAKQAPKRKGA